MQSFSGSKNFTESINKEKIRDLVTAWIVNRQRPLLIVEDPELADIFRYINPAVNLPSADTIKNTIIQQYIQGKKDLQVNFFNII